MKLVYHKPNSSGHVSPFDDALMQVAKNAKPLLLMSPYIGFEAINRIVDQAQEWKLLSDIEAWLLAGNQRHRVRCWNFIEANIERIRHIPDLHAKVAIGNRKVFLGSANFTNKGLLGRTELSVLLDDPKIIIESTDWFNSLWNSADKPIIEEGDALIVEINKTQKGAFRSKVRLSSSMNAVSAVLSQSTRPNNGFDIAASVAKAEIADSIKYHNLADAYRSISDKLFGSSSTFTFAELLVSVRKIYQQVTSRDLWTFISREIPHHPVGGLFTDGFDRYTYVQGVFRPWQASDLSLVAKIDQYLLLVVTELPLLPNYTYFPSEDKLTRLGLPTHQLLMMQQHIIDAGLIVEHDVPGDIEQYSVDTYFEWPKRWRKFAKTRDFFESKLKNSNALKTINQDAFLEDEFAIKDENYNFISRHAKPSSIYKDEGITKFMQQELRDAAAKVNLEPNMVKKAHDAIMSEALEKARQNSQFVNRIIYVEQNDIDNLLSEMESKGLSPTLLAEFKKKAFKKVSNDRLNPSALWPATKYLSLYPRTLQIWWKLI